MKGEFKSAIGDWEDGAENAIKIEVQDAQDYDQIAYTAAKLGSMFKQKAVIAFQNKNDGEDSIYKISAPKGMDDMRKILSDNGIKFRTIFEDRGKSNVTIFDKGSELLSKVNNVMEVANATGQIIKGVGEFIGGDTRIQGEQAYRKAISDYETKFPTRTRHRFSAGIGLHYNGSAYQLGDCGTGAGGFKEGNTCSKGGGAGTTMTPSWARENPEKASKETAKNTTLFHGTSVDVLKSIKEKGLLPSKSGVWGGGKVYSTDSLDLAMEYGVLRATGAKAKVSGRTMIGIISVLAEGFQSVADNIPTVKAQKMGKTGLAAVSKIFTKDGAVSPKSIRKIDIFDVDSIRKYVYENGPKPKALATKELEDGKKYIYVPIVIEIPEGEEDENLAYPVGGATMPATIKSAVIQGQGRKEELSNYTKPKLRERIKNRILRGTKGGKAGQWSARKAQLLVQAYEKAGGGYKGGKTKGQSSLKKWTKEKWRTSDNSKSIQRGKKTKRYLPSRVWDKLSPAEKATANRTKAQGSKKGKQFVPNPPSVTKKFSYNSKTEFFDPSQPRDESGKWTKAGGVISDMLKKGWDKVGGPFYEKNFPEGKVTAELKPWFNSDELRISHIETEPTARGKGIGSKALKDITESADKVGAKLIGGVSPTGKGGMTKEQLFKWYEKNGFFRKPFRGDPKKKSDEIERLPRAEKLSQFQYNGKRIELNCGTGAGGFKEGNTCSKGGGGKGGGKGKGKSEKDESEKDREKLLKEIDAEIERLENEPKAKEAVRKMRELQNEVAKAEGIDPEFATATFWSLRDSSRYVQDKDIKKTFENPTPQHKKWIESIKASELNPNAKSENPVAVILMGSPASGKTTTGRPFAQKILGNRETTKIDPDAIKAKAKGFEGWNAGAFHEESSILAEKVIFPEAIAERHNILLDITGKNSDKVATMAKTLKGFGYTIGLVHVDVDDKVALKRASARFNKPNGRWVPYRYIKGSAQNARNTWGKLTKEGIADIGYSIDGNAERVQGKDAPIRETYGKIAE
jgi:adenylate kinase family enzyme/GNAT superfamily N-acetyltransferase